MYIQFVNYDTLEISENELKFIKNLLMLWNKSKSQIYVTYIVYVKSKSYISYMNSLIIIECPDI